MNSVITWGQLFTYVSVFLFLYYAIILFLFYRRDLIITSKPGRKWNYDSYTSLAGHDASRASTTDQDNHLYNAVHELIEDCKPVFQAAVQEKLEKEQVLEALQVRIKKYASLKGAAFQAAINNHIEQELNDQCNMVLLEKDAASLWRS